MYWYSLCLIVYNVSGSDAMTTRNRCTNVAYTRNGHIKLAREIGLRTEHPLISVSPLYIICMEYVGIAHCQLVSSATVIPVFKPAEK